jgi:chaperonin GroES
MSIRPLHDRIIVKRIEHQRTTASGIFIPDTATEKPEQGEVVAVGSGRVLPNGDTRAPQIQVGETVLFAKYAGQTVKVNDHELLVLREDDVMGVIEVPVSEQRKAA